MQSRPSDPTLDSNAHAGSEPRTGCAIELVHFLVKEVEWIRMLSTRLCNGSREQERIGADVESIRDLSNSVARSMRGFLDDARGAASRTGDLVEIECLVAQAVRQVGRRGHAHSISTHLDENVRGVTVPAELLVAVVAVVENAIESIGSGGEVTVRVGCDRDDLVISVEDSGVGMDEAVLSTCRAPGFTTRRASGGQGFGLYSASRILERAHGNLHLRSKPGAGTCVSLLVPTAQASATAPSSPPSSDPGLRRLLPGSTS